MTGRYNLYLGTRASQADVSAVLGRSVSLIANTDEIRSAARSHGIKKTELGRQLEFYAVTQKEINALCDPDKQIMEFLRGNTPPRPLVVVDRVAMEVAHKSVANRPKYRLRGGVWRYPEVYRVYKAEMAAAIADALVRVGDDRNLRRKTAA